MILAGFSFKPGETSLNASAVRQGRRGLEGAGRSPHSCSTPLLQFGEQMEAREGTAPPAIGWILMQRALSNSLKYSLQKSPQMLRAAVLERHEQI